MFSTEFDRLDNFSDGLALVEKDNEYFYIDNTGTIKMRLGDNIDYAGNFFEGYASVKKGDMYGFIDKSGAVIVPFEYSSVNAFHEGISVVRKNDEWGILQIITE